MSLTRIMPWWQIPWYESLKLGFREITNRCELGFQEINFTESVGFMWRKNSTENSGNEPPLDYQALPAKMGSDVWVQWGNEVSVGKEYWALWWPDPTGSHHPENSVCLPHRIPDQDFWLWYLSQTEPQPASLHPHLSPAGLWPHPVPPWGTEGSWLLGPLHLTLTRRLWLHFCLHTRSNNLKGVLPRWVHVISFLHYVKSK
jgi:hypothetical protein